MKVKFENGSTIEATDGIRESNGVIRILGIDLALNDTDNTAIVRTKCYVKDGKIVKCEVDK